MKYFECPVCEKQIFFAKFVCDHCLSSIGYIASEKEMTTFKKLNAQEWVPVAKSINIPVINLVITIPIIRYVTG